MTLDTFTQIMQLKLNRFIDAWKKANESMPDLFPSNLPEETWKNALYTFDDSHEETKDTI